MGLFNYYPDNHKGEGLDLEKKIFVHSLIFPTAFVMLFLIIESIEQVFELNFARGGIYPLHLKGIPGIFLSPLIHSGFSHLFANATPFFIFLTALIYYYRKISYRIFFQIYLISGICVWIGGREAWHIGASGVVYGLAAFHLTSGFLRNDVRLLTVSVIVVFLYGSMFWGLFPIKPDISWESHLWGALSGIFLAVYYRKYGVRRKKFEWEDEPDEDEGDTNGDTSNKNPDNMSTTMDESIHS